MDPSFYLILLSINKAFNCIPSDLYMRLYARVNRMIWGIYGKLFLSVLSMLNYESCEHIYTEVINKNEEFAVIDQC